MKSRIEREKETAEQMIRLFCRHKEHHETICESCAELIEYAKARLDHCKFGEAKPTCKSCPTHCYKPEMREKMKTVMRYAGPRMLFYHPIAALRHLFHR